MPPVIFNIHGINYPVPTQACFQEVRSQLWCVCVCVCVCVCALSHVGLFVTPWPLACQTPLSMGFSRQEYWSRWSFSPPGNLPNPGIKPMSPESPALAGGFFTNVPPTWFSDLGLAGTLGQLLGGGTLCRPSHTTANAAEPLRLGQCLPQNQPLESNGQSGTSILLK